MPIVHIETTLREVFPFQTKTSAPFPGADVCSICLIPTPSWEIFLVWGLWGGLVDHLRLWVSEILCPLFHCATVTASLLFIPRLPYLFWPWSFTECQGIRPESWGKQWRRTLWGPGLQTEGLERQAGLAAIPELEPCSYLAYLELKRE